MIFKILSNETICYNVGFTNEYFNLVGNFGIIGLALLGFLFVVYRLVRVTHG